MRGAHEVDAPLEVVLVDAGQGIGGPHRVVALVDTTGRGVTLPRQIEVVLLSDTDAGDALAGSGEVSAAQAEFGR